MKFFVVNTSIPQKNPDQKKFPDKHTTQNVQTISKDPGAPSSKRSKGSDEDREKFPSKKHQLCISNELSTASDFSYQEHPQ